MQRQSARRGSSGLVSRGAGLFLAVAGLTGLWFAPSSALPAASSGGVEPLRYGDAGEGLSTCSAPPGEATDLILAPDGITLSWTAPAATGGSPVVYDVLRSAVPGDFGMGAVCVEENDGSDTAAVDPFVPALGSAGFYLVRVENPCGWSGVGRTSSGAARPAARPCGPCISAPDCDDGQFCNGAETCDMAGACQPGPPPSCGRFACNATGQACYATCTLNSQCATGFVCSGGDCRKPPGQTCAAASECASGFCADGVCCASACAGVCEACHLAGRAGFCDPIPTGTDPQDECPTTSASTCGTTGACSGARSCQLHPLGTTCAVASCSGATTSNRPDVCDGSGTCVDGGTQDCSPYACDGATGSCRTTCASSTNCAPGFSCSGGQCLRSDGQACTLNSQCASNACCSGFCRSLASDVNNCGACGLACTNPNGTTACSSGTCQPTCNSGWGSCDGNPGIGCETSLRTLTDCGSCGVPCSRTNASASCSTGTCTLTSCNSGFSNCDGNDANGCEVQHSASANTCGSAEFVGSQCGDSACGFLCPGSNWQTFATRFGRNARWFRARALECSSCSADIRARITLAVPPGSDYDLYVYSACGTLIASSTAGTGATDQVTISKSDSGAADDSFDYWVEVRYFSGSSCTNWTLTFEGRNC